MNLDGKMMRKIIGTVTDESFASLLVLEGKGTISCNGEEVDFQKGDSLFLPADSGEFTVEGECEALLTRIGKKASPVRIAFYMISRNMSLGLVDMSNKIIDSITIPIDKSKLPEEVIKQGAEEIQKLIEKLDLKIDNCIGVGAGIPGTIDSKNGKVIYSNNIGWKDVMFSKELQKYIPLPVYINNNANCQALGEMKNGSASKHKNIVLITVGNGVGGSVILNREIFEGGLTGGSELGHTVIKMGGQQCTCGRKGCLEAYVSIPALIKQAREAALEDESSLLWDLCGGKLKNLTEKMIFDGVKGSDKTSVELVERYVKYLSTGIVNITNIFRPDLILLSGIVFCDNDHLVGEIKKYIANECFGGDLTGIPDVSVAALGKEAGLIGAANLI